jgi:hypothetical protein
VRQYVDKGFLKISFVKSEDNLSDGYTKNTSIKVYERHHGEFVADKSYIEHDNRNSYDRKGVGGILTCSDDVTNNPDSRAGVILRARRDIIFSVLLEPYILNVQCEKTALIQSTRRRETHE